MTCLQILMQLHVLNYECLIHYILFAYILEIILNIVVLFVIRYIFFFLVYITEFQKKK